MEQENRNIVENVRNWYRELPDKKKYFELASAVLSVPVLVTVILINLNNLTGKNAAKNADNKLTPSYMPSVTIIREEKVITPTTDAKENTPTPLSSTPTSTTCKKEVGPVIITAPRDNQVISSDFVSVELTEQTTEYCPVVWSYSIDGSAFSNYSDKSISLYNLPSGEHEINVKVKSTASEDEIQLRRSFYYNNPKSVTIAPTAPATTSALIE